MKLRDRALVVTALGLAGCSKTTTAENVSTTEIVSNDASVLNASDNGADLDTSNAAGNSL